MDALDRELDRIGGRDADAHRDAERKPESSENMTLVGSATATRTDLSSSMSHGDREVAAGEVLGEQQRYLGLDHLDVEVEILELVLLGQDARDRCASPSQVDEDLAEPLLRRRPLLGQRLFELLRGDHTIPDQECAERGPRVAGGFHVTRIGRKGHWDEGCRAT